MIVVHQGKKTVAPSCGPGNSTYSATESLTAQDIENYFRIGPTRPKFSTNSVDNSTSSINGRKIVQYLRPTSFEQQQKGIRQLNKNKMNIIQGGKSGLPIRFFPWLQNRQGLDDLIAIY
jgi:hypothetical protein